MNPYHVEPRTQAANVLRGNGPTAINARKDTCNKGHVFDSDNTRIDYRGRRRCRACKRVDDRAYKKRKRHG